MGAAGAAYAARYPQRPGGPGQVRRRRFAFAVALLCSGRRRASAEAIVGNASTRLISSVAAVFSETMRLYSASEQVFCAINRVRRVIVSQDAQASSAIIIEAENAV